MKKRVLHILGSLNLGGAENLVLDLLKRGSNDPNIEYYLVYNIDSSNERVDKFNCKDITYLPCSKGVISTLSYINKLHNYLKDNRIDVVHCHNNINAYWAKIAANYTNVKRVILTIHGLNLNLNYLRDKFKLSRRLSFNLDKSLLSKMEITYVSNKTKSYYAESYGWREINGDVIYNGIDSSKFTLIEKQDCEGVTHLIDNRVLKFGMVGNFNTPVRLQKLICQAIAFINREHYNSNKNFPFTFIFAGASNSTHPYLFNECVEFCKSEGILDTHVTFIGSCNYVPQLLATLDGYVYASSADTFGISVVEAIMSNIPVICSNIDTFVEVTHNGEMATLVENSVESFAKAIMELCNRVNNDLYNLKKETVKKRQNSIDCYSIVKCYSEYKRLYIV